MQPSRIEDDSEKTTSDLAKEDSIKKQYIDITKEPFIEAFLGKVPKEIANSFTSDQLVQIKLIFGTREPTEHIIDKRSVFGFGKLKYYMVFLLGKNRREMTEAEKDINAAGRMFFIMLIGFLLFSASTIALYLLKSFLGIDVFPNFSLGLWSMLSS